MNLLKKSIICFCLSSGLLANNLGNMSNIEELIVKDKKIVMIREGSGQKDYFFHIDKISFIQKDISKVSTRFIITLINGEKVILYKKENYKKIMQVFLDWQQPIQPIQPIQTNTKQIISNNNKQPVNMAEMEKKEIKDMDISKMEKIIALEPTDIKTSE